MTKEQVQHDLRRLMRNEFGAVEQAARSDDLEKVRRSLAELGAKLKRLKRAIDGLPDA